MVNNKKPIKLKNNTKYFDKSKSKVYNCFGSPDTYQARRLKIEGYETRLYWQFRYCDEHSGQTFFYTLTYNDAHIPNVYGFNCFDYEDLRDLLTGGFRKQLLRKYGTTFKYFVGAELGDGKGERGMHNNPHYHFLFFLEPANNPRFPYIKISPEDFRHLIRLYWQGFDEAVDGFHDYREAKYGIAREGENCGLVVDYHAGKYCTKYVCKDVKLKTNEKIVIKKVRFRFRKEYKNSVQSYIDFFNDVINEFYNIPYNSKKTEWCYTPVELVRRLIPDFFSLDDDLGLPVDELDDVNRCVASQQIIRHYNLWEEYCKYVRTKIDECVRLALNEYRNRYCNKCRISHGVGDYALNFISDELNPSTQVPTKKGFRERPLSMYYYRKLFTKVIIDKVGSPIRVLNDLGIQYKLAHLDERINKKSEEVQNNLETLLSTPGLYTKMRNSDINTEVRYSFVEFFQRLNYLLEENNNNINEIYKRYAEYKLVYEDRFFKFDYVGDIFNSPFPPINIYGDYHRFLIPSIYSVSRSDLRLSSFIESDYKGFMAYSEHPYFLRYIGIFNVLDMCSDYFFIQKDNKEQKDAEEIAATRRFHTVEKVKEFYKNLCRF